MQILRGKTAMAVGCADIFFFGVKKYGELYDTIRRNLTSVAAWPARE